MERPYRKLTITEKGADALRQGHVWVYAGEVTDGENGFLIDKDIKSFETKLRELMADPQRVRRVGAQASRSIVRSWEDVVDEVLDRYNALISSRCLIARP